MIIAAIILATIVNFSNRAFRSVIVISPKSYAVSIQYLVSCASFKEIPNILPNSNRLRAAEASAKFAPIEQDDRIICLVTTCDSTLRGNVFTDFRISFTNNLVRHSISFPREYIIYPPRKTANLTFYVLRFAFYITNKIAARISNRSDSIIARP